MSIGTKYNITEFKCPTCFRDDFETERGVRYHHSEVHNKKLPNLICEVCGDKFYYKSRRAKCDECIKNTKIKKINQVK